jgi:hypothetical protein
MALVGDGGCISCSGSYWMHWLLMLLLLLGAIVNVIVVVADADDIII